MVFNATFNNISVISWQSVLLVEKTTDLSHVTDSAYVYFIIHSIPYLENNSRDFVVKGNMFILFLGVYDVLMVKNGFHHLS